jgi:hypothetical protein
MKKSLSKVKTVDKPEVNEILPEYDFRRSLPNKFASRYATGGTVVVVDPNETRVSSVSRANDAIQKRGRS